MRDMKLPENSSPAKDDLLASLTIIHDKEERKFYTIINNEEAFVSYDLPAAERIHFITTLVPFRFRGKGIANKLVETALEYAATNNLTVSTGCWYIKNYLGRVKRQSSGQK